MLSMAVGIGFHYVRPNFKQPYPGIFGVTVEEFRAQLELLGRYGEYIGLSDIRSWLFEGKSLPERAWLVTFDDGLREQYEHALPVLDDLCIPAVFFASTRPLYKREPLMVHVVHLLRSQIEPSRLVDTVYNIAEELGIKIGTVDHERAVSQYFYDTPEVAEIKYLLNFALPCEARDDVIGLCFSRLLDWDVDELVSSLYMDKSQLRELAVRGYLGTHAHTHRPLGTLSEAEIETDIRTSLDLLEYWTKRRPDAIAYPYGSLAACTEATGHIARKLGIKMGFTMERARIDEHARPMCLPRCAPNDLPGGSMPRWSKDSLFQEISCSGWYAA